MAYFSNGSEGMDYEYQFCHKCVHYGDDDGPGCPVMGAHMIFNSDQIDSTGEHNEEPAKSIHTILNMLIPAREDGFADQCSMFVEEKNDITFSSEPLTRSGR